MKLHITRLLLIGLPLGGLTSIQTPAAAATTTPAIPQVDQVTAQGGAILATVKGKTYSPTNTVGMPFEIKVMTNMTYTVSDGPARKLTEGQVLKSDGMLVSPNGSIMPVVDHVAMLGAEVTIVKNGQSAPVRSVTELGNGSKVFPDGTIYDSKGNKTRLLDGQLLKLNGAAIPAVDTVTLKEGKVVVQKDGAMITVKPGRTIMMNNGTKVFSDGKLIYFDGATKQLSEGETVELTGVRRLRQ